MAAPEEAREQGAAAQERQDLVGRSARGAAATTLVALLARGAGLLTTVVVTYFVSKAEYGNANLAMIVVGVLHQLTLLTPQQALLTRRDRFEAASRLARFYVAWSGVLVVALLGLFGRWIVSALGQPEAQALVLVYLGAMMLERLAVIPTLRLNYELRFRELAQMDLWSQLVYVAATVGGAALGFGGYSLPLGMAARHGVRLLLLGLRCGATLWPDRPAWGPEERRLAREILAYSLPVHLGAIMEFFTAYLDNVMVGKLYSAAGQGLYVVGYTLAMTPADTIAAQGALALVRALGVSDAATRRRTFLLSLRYLALLVFPIGVLTALCAPTLERVLLPPRWHGVAPIAVGLSLGAMSMAVKRLVFVHITALHRPWTAALTEGLRLLFFLLGLLMVGLSDAQRVHLGRVGWAVSAAFAASAALSLKLSLSADGLRMADGLVALGPPALGSALLGALLWLLQRALPPMPGVPRIGLELAAGVAIYVAVIRLLHPATYREATAWLRAQFGR